MQAQNFSVTYLKGKALDVRITVSGSVISLVYNEELV